MTTSINLTRVNSPTFVTNQGFQGDKSTNYLDLNYVPSTDAVNLVQGDLSLGWWIYTADSSDNFQSNLFGWAGSTQLRIRNSNILQRTFSSGVVADLGSTGLRGASHINSNTIRYYKDTATQDVTDSTSALSIVNSNLWLLRNGSGYSDALVSINFGGARMDTEWSAMYSAFNTYMTSI